MLAREWMLNVQHHVVVALKPATHMKTMPVTKPLLSKSTIETHERPGRSPQRNLLFPRPQSPPTPENRSPADPRICG